MKSLHQLRIFIETARLGSLSACARHLDLSPAVVSAAVKRLEGELDTLLFIRSTRQLRLTDKGRQFLEHCQDALEILDQATALLQEKNQELSGTLHLSAPSDLGRNKILPWIDQFMRFHPKVSVQLHLSDSHADLYGQKIDLSLRYGHPKDSSLIALPLALENTYVLCASPNYLNQFGTPTSPQLLSEHNCLCLGHNERLFSKWMFEKDGEKVKVAVAGNRSSKDGDVVRRWAVAGRGIALKSYLDVADDLNAGRLLNIKFSGWQTQRYPLYMIFPERHLINPLFEALKAHLTDCIQRILMSHGL